MKLIKVGAGILNQTPFDWDHNLSNIKEAIRLARENAVTILCLPELCITGYGCEDDFFRTDLRNTAVHLLLDIATATRGMIVNVGLPLLHNNGLFNCGALLVDGKIAGIVAKKNLAGDGIHYEPRWFEPWHEGTIAHIKIGRQNVPIGDIHFRVGDVKIGYEICEDAWVYNRPGNKLAASAVDIILNPSASHFSFGKLEIRKQLVAEGSRAFGASYVYSNLIGNEAGRAIYDGGAIIASGGKLLSIGKRFTFQNVDLTTAVVDIDHTRMLQVRTYSFTPKLEDDPSCIDCEFEFPHAELEDPSPQSQEPWEKSPFVKEEEFARAIALGLFDYLRKSRSMGYTVSLSGGADSSAVCCLVGLMVEFVVGELGLTEFKKRLDYISELKALTSDRQIIGKLLTCAYQATANSSSETRQAAQRVAEALGAKFFEFDIEQIVEGYTNMVSEAIGRKLSFETDDLALQNIQARTRNPGVWLLANIYNSILLCTSNRSEGAVGYCTMDGDTSGGLAPLAGVDKAFVRRWLRWLQSVGPSGTGALPELEAVTGQAPRPELRPAEYEQTAEKDLMPYEILDAIEDASIEGNLSPLECFRLLNARFPDLAPRQLAQWIEKFYNRWSRNQWKRERLPAALHVASRNLDPRTWRRSPILSGAFARELAHMWDFVNQNFKTEAPGRGDLPDMHVSEAGKTDSNGGDGSEKTVEFTFDPDSSALLIIDAQIGFGSNGELPVPDAEEIVPVVNSLMPKFRQVLATQDWHPADHVSFAINHANKQIGDTLEMDGCIQPLFPMHCVENTRGAQFFEGLNTDSINKVFRKGNDPEIDCFSPFLDNLGGKATDLDDHLRESKLENLYICGVATNYCVKAAAIDAVKLGYRVTVVTDACRGIDASGNKVEQALSEMRRQGVQLIESKELLKTGAKKKGSRRR